MRHLHYVAKRLRPWRISKYSIREEKSNGRCDFNEGNYFKECLRMVCKPTTSWKGNYLTDYWKYSACKFIKIRQQTDRLEQLVNKKRQDQPNLRTITRNWLQLHMDRQ